MWNTLVFISLCFVRLGFLAFTTLNFIRWDVAKREPAHWQEIHPESRLSYTEKTSHLCSRNWLVNSLNQFVHINSFTFVQQNNNGNSLKPPTVAWLTPTLLTAEITLQFRYLWTVQQKALWDYQVQLLLNTPGHSTFLFCYCKHLNPICKNSICTSLLISVLETCERNSSWNLDY